MIERLRTFHGVHAGVPPQQLPDGFSPSAYNTALDIGDSALILRPHFSSSDRIDTQADSFTEWVYYEGSTAYTHRVLLTSPNHTLWVTTGLNSAPTQIFGVTVPSGTQGCSWAVANNALFGAARGSGTFKVYRKLGVNTLYGAPIGITAPTAPTFVSQQAGSGELSGTVDVAISYVNVHTGTESSRSPILSTTMSAPGNSLTIFAAAPTQAEVTHVRVYIRKQSLQTKLWRNAAMQYSQTNITLDFTDDQLNVMTLEAPTEHEFDPPPSGIVDLCWWQSRMFATDGTTLYYSQVGNPEQWDPEFYEQVSPQDAQRIVALRPIRTGVLGIFKERSIYALTGDSPQTWNIQLVTPDYGVIAPDSLVSLDGVVYAWGHQGPWKWAVGEELPGTLAEEVVLPRSLAGTLTLQSTTCKAAVDPVNKRVLFAPTTTDRWKILPFNAREGKWEALGWDLIAPATGGPAYTLAHFATMKYPTGVWGPVASFAGSNVGRLYELSWTVTPPTPIAITSGTTSVLQLASSPGTTSVEGAVIDLARMTVAWSVYSATGTTVTLNTPLSVAPSAGSLFVPYGGMIAQWTSRILEGDSKDDGKRSEMRKRYLWIGTRPENLAGHVAVWIDAALKRTWPFRIRGRVAATGDYAQVGAIYWTRGKLHELTLRSTPYHDRR